MVDLARQGERAASIDPNIEPNIEGCKFWDCGWGGR